MANLKEIRTRIDSVATTKQVTSAMKMVSASKLRRAQDAILQLRPYSEKLNEIAENISSQVTSIPNLNVTEQRKVKRALIIAVNANRGLCGSFNSNVNKKVGEIIESNTYKDLQESGNIDFIAIGKNATKFLKNNNYNIIKNYNDIYDHLNYEAVSEIAEELINSFIKGKYDLISIVYNQFKNAATQILVEEQYLPLKINKKEESKELDYIFEPDKVKLLKEIIPKTLKTQLYKVILDSNASEQGARMTAMHKATDNATELGKELTLQYNKIRQASITNEILEIVGGAEALNA